MPAGICIALPTRRRQKVAMDGNFAQAQTCNAWSQAKRTGYLYSQVSRWAGLRAMRTGTGWLNQLMGLNLGA